ncbi:uncharacterized protein [Diadema antillarum]|uniref:uncharacterized protein n=1 Tax=Diadema antillarum TaxID=105358 RepID=UPI003A87A96D
MLIERETIRTSPELITPVAFDLKYQLPLTHAGDPIVLITCNRAFLDFAQNWIESVRRLGTRPNVLAIAEDIEAYRTLRKHPREVAAVMTPRAASPQAALKYLSREYNLLINRRPAYIYRLLQKGKDVLFCDVDMVWLRDPLPYLVGDYDVVLQEDLHDPKVVYCAGFVFFRATNATRSLVWEWMDRIHKARNRLPDQKILNDLLDEKFDPNLRMKVLDSDLFPNGKLYFDVRWREQRRIPPVIVHNNWIEGHELKVERFKEHGFWYI